MVVAYIFINLSRVLSFSNNETSKDSHIWFVCIRIMYKVIREKSLGSLKDILCTPGQGLGLTQGILRLIIVGYWTDNPAIFSTL